MPQVNPPPSRALHAWAQDPETGTFVTFGGGGETLLGDTWTMRLRDGTAEWTQVTAGVKPTPRFGAFSGMDEATGTLWLFSGQVAGGRFADDVWLLDVRADPPCWDIAPEVTTTPPGRRNGAVVMDPTGPRLWVFGGTFDGMTSAPGLWALRAERGGARFDAVARDAQPPMRSSGIMAAVGGAVWRGFGNDRSAYADMTRLGW